MHLLDLNDHSQHLMQYTATALNCMQKWIDSYFVGPQGADTAIWLNSFIQRLMNLMSNAVIRLTTDPMTISWLPKLVLSHQNFENPWPMTQHVLHTHCMVSFRGMLQGQRLWGILSLLVYQSIIITISNTLNGLSNNSSVGSMVLLAVLHIISSHHIILYVCSSAVCDMEL